MVLVIAFLVGLLVGVLVTGLCFPSRGASVAQLHMQLASQKDDRARWYLRARELEWHLYEVTGGLAVAEGEPAQRRHHPLQEPLSLAPPNESGDDSWSLDTSRRAA